MRKCEAIVCSRQKQWSFRQTSFFEADKTTVWVVSQETGGITLCGTTTCRTYKWIRLMQIQVCVFGPLETD
jgi:hypothetical protein